MHVHDSRFFFSTHMILTIAKYQPYQLYIILSTLTKRFIQTLRSDPEGRNDPESRLHVLHGSHSVQRQHTRWCNADDNDGDSEA